MEGKAKATRRSLCHWGQLSRRAGFVNDFNELYTYYKNTRLLQLAIRDGKLLASFQIGERDHRHPRVRWSISSDGSEVRATSDNRGERDIAFAGNLVRLRMAAGYPRDGGGGPLPT
ncbi:DNA repair ATPase [Pseudomonas aeruginosa]